MKIDNISEDLAHPQLSVRALLIHDGHVLMVEHDHHDARGRFWVLPGGGVEKGETITDAIIREVWEETSLECSPIGVVHIRETELYSLRGIEIYVRCAITGGTPELGVDPEKDSQVLKTLKWVSAEELGRITFFPETLRGLLPEWLMTGFIPTIEMPSFIRISF